MNRVPPRRRFPRALAIGGAAVLSILLPACGEDGAGGLFETTCDDIGQKPSNMESLTPTEVIVLLDVSANDAATAERMSDDVTAVLGKVLDENDDVLLTGYVAGGTGASLEKLDCMGGREYVFAGGNERRQAAERDDLKTHLSNVIEDAVTATAVDAAGDARVLLRQVPVTAKSSDPLVILWSSFLGQGSDCLTFEMGESPSAELAASVADRCQQQNLLPDLGDARVTIVGAGSSPDRPDLGPFGQSLARELCTRMAAECDVR